MAIRLICTLMVFCTLHMLPMQALAQSYAWFDDLSVAPDWGLLDIASLETEDGIYAVGRSYRGGVLRKYDPDGTILWSVEIEIYYRTEVFSVAVDQSGVYVGGRSWDVNPTPNRQNRTGFVKKFDHTGQLLWTYADDTESDTDFTEVSDIWDLAMDEDGVYSIGNTKGLDDRAVLRRISKADGALDWKRVLPQMTGGISEIEREGSRLYVSADDRRIYTFDTGGNLISDIPIGTAAISQMIAYDGHLYITGSWSGNYEIRKVDFSGTLIWRKELATLSIFSNSPYASAEGSLGALVVNAGGLFVGGHGMLQDNQPGGLIALLDHDGNELESWGFPGLNMYIQELDMHANRLYVGGFIRPRNDADHFLAEFSTVELSPGQVLSLGDTNGDGRQDIGVFTNNFGTGPTEVRIKDAGSSDLALVTALFDTARRPVVASAIPDLNNNQAAEIIVVGRSPAVIEVRDSKTGNELTMLALNPDLEPVDLALVPDQNGNGSPEVAVLGRFSQGWVGVEIRDPVSGERFPYVWFNPNFDPIDLGVQPDSNGDGYVELAVLGVDDRTNAPDKVEIRSLDGTLVDNFWLGKRAVAQQLEPVPWIDVIANPSVQPASKLAVLRTGINDSWIEVVVYDSVLGQQTSAVGFNGNPTPSKMFSMRDLGGSSAPELVVMGSLPNRSDMSRAEVRDATDGTLLENHWVWTGYRQIDITPMPDMNANGAEEVCLLTRRISDGRLRTFVKDGATGDTISIVEF